MCFEINPSFVFWVVLSSCVCFCVLVFRLENHPLFEADFDAKSSRRATDEALSVPGLRPTHSR